MSATVTTELDAGAIALPLAPGVIVGERYAIVRVIAQGGMGVVYEAHDRQREQRVAVKCMRPERATSELARARFEREAQLMERMDHDGIVRIADSGIHQGQTPFIVMEYLDGMTLDHFLEVAVRPTLPAAIEIVVQVCRAMAYAHSLDTAHRDLKPSNIILLRNGDSLAVKLLDFGIGARTSGVHTPLTASNADLGTACYMSPEQARGERSAGKASDVYAIGLILYELLTGKRAYVGSSYNAVLFDIITRPLHKVNSVVPECPPAVAVVVDRCLAVDPRHRYPDALALLRVLEAAVESSRVDATLRPVSLRRGRALANVTGWTWIAVALAAGGVTVSVALYVSPSSTIPSPGNAPLLEVPGRGHIEQVVEQAPAVKQVTLRPTRPSPRAWQEIAAPASALASSSPGGLRPPASTSPAPVRLPPLRRAAVAASASAASEVTRDPPLAPSMPSGSAASDQNLVLQTRNPY